MRRLRIVPAAIVFIVTASATAGTEKVAFPAYQTHVLYDVLDQPEIKEIREAYINADALKGIRPGQPLPSGTVLSLPTFKARVNEKGELVKDPNGRLVRGPLDRIVVMEKRTGWGVEYPEDLRNGEWEYARFRADGTRDPQANIKGCFECHKPESKRDFVFTLDQIILKAAAR
jgi:Cytochrome P460